MKDTKHGFKITINNKAICRAGFENDNSVLTCILTSSFLKKQNRNELDFYVSGLNSDTQQRAKWFMGDMQRGDKIELEVITDNFDAPNSLSEPATEEEIIKNKLKMYHKLEKELKEYL